MIMVKVRIIKEGMLYPVGKILNVSKEEAKEALDSKSVEIVSEKNIPGVGIVEEEDKKYIEDEDGKIEQIKSIKEQYLELIIKKKYSQASEILVNQIMFRNHIYTTKDDNKPEIYIYKDGIYVPEGISEIKEQLRLMIGDCYNSWIANQVIDKIKADTFIEPSQFFNNDEKFKIAVKNGILDLKEIRLEKFDPRKIYFSKIPIFYEEMMKCPKIDQFLKDVLPNEDDINVFYEIAGFGLVKDYFMETAIMMVGTGRNGKTKTIELLKRLVGVNNCSSISLNSIKHDSPFISDLFGKHFNLAGDVSSSDFKETGMFKQLTGRDLISANRKYKNVITFENYAKFIFACNELPKVYDYSDGFWERWILLEFPYYFADEDIYNDTKEENRKNWRVKNPNIISEITTATELSGFLNQAIIGLHRLFNNKKFSYSTGTEEVKNKWIRKADSFMAFCMDSLEPSYENKIRKKDLRKKYHKYCKDHKVPGVSDISIKITLQEMFGVIDDYVSIDGFSGQEYCWIGVKLKENLEKKDVTTI